MPLTDAQTRDLVHKTIRAAYGGRRGDHDPMDALNVLVSALATFVHHAVDSGAITPADGTAPAYDRLMADVVLCLQEDGTFLEADAPLVAPMPSRVQ